MYDNPYYWFITLYWL